MKKIKRDKLLDTLKVLIQIDDIEVIKCVIESLIEQLEDEGNVNANK